MADDFEDSFQHDPVTERTGEFRFKAGRLQQATVVTTMQPPPEGQRGTYTETRKKVWSDVPQVPAEAEDEEGLPS